MDFQARRAGRDRRTHLEHVRAEDALGAGPVVVGVVLHERGAAGQPVRHDLQCPEQQRGLPVALAAEAVAVGHQALHRQPGQLAQTTEVLEIRGERAEAAVGEEHPKPGFDARAVAQRVMSLAAQQEFRGNGVGVEVFADQFVDGRLGNVIDHGDEVVDGVGVDRCAEVQFGVDLVAFGDRDTAHVVTEAGELEVPHGIPRGGDPSPGRNSVSGVLVVDVARDRGARNSDSRLDVAEFPVAVCGLVQVHEVHVETGPGECFVGLRVKVQQRLAQRVEAPDPHLGRGERVHPGDDSDT